MMLRGLIGILSNAAGFLREQWPLVMVGIALGFAWWYASAAADARMAAEWANDRAEAWETQAVAQLNRVSALTEAHEKSNEIMGEWLDRRDATGEQIAGLREAIQRANDNAESAYGQCADVKLEPEVSTWFMDIVDKANAEKAKQGAAGASP